MKKNSLVLLIENNSSSGKLPISWREIRACVSGAIKAGGIQPGGCEVSLYLVDDVEMRGLNKEHRGIDRTTDVLSFPQFDSPEKISADPDGRYMIGDIVISMETLSRRCIERSEKESSDFRRLIVHSVLHLLGYDHKSKPERTVMRQLEDVAIDRL